MCNGCCIKDLKWENGKLTMLKSGVWSVVPGDMSPSLPPSLPPDEELADPSQLLACRKALGLWQVIEDFAEAMMSSISGASLTPLNASRQFFFEYGTNLKAANWEVVEFINNHMTDDPEINADWLAHMEDTKATFICAAQDALEKFALLTTSDFDWLYAYDFDSPSARLDDFLTDLLVVPENAAWREWASNFVFQQEGFCDCEGSTPPPPVDYNDPDVPETWINLQVKIVSAPGNEVLPGDLTPQDLIDQVYSPAYGSRISNDRWTMGLAGVEGNGQLGLLITLPDGISIESMTWLAHWGGGDAGETFQYACYSSNDADTAFGTNFENSVDGAFASLPGEAAVGNVFAGGGATKYVYLHLRTLGATPGDAGAEAKNFDIHLKAMDDYWENEHVKLQTPFNPEDYAI